MIEDSLVVSDEDEKLFREMFKDVRRLKNDRIEKHRPTKIARTTIKRQAEQEEKTVHDPISDLYTPDNQPQTDYIEFYRPGLQHKRRKKFKRGEIPFEFELDLHGCTVKQARKAVVQFIHDAQQPHQTCVRIIHGKGLRISDKPAVLKENLKNWLPQFEQVLAYCSARPVDGGTGALYVLIKASKD